MHLNEFCLSQIQRLAGESSKTPVEAGEAPYRALMGTLQQELGRMFGRRRAARVLSRTFYSALAEFVRQTQSDPSGDVSPEDRAYVRRMIARYPWMCGPQFIATRLISRKNYASVDLSPPGLEIGIDSGITSELLFNDRPFTVGSEPTLLGILSARSRRQNSAYVALDGRSIPFREDTFKSISANNVLYHTEDRRAAIGEMTRVLAPGGTIAFDDVTPQLRDRRAVSDLFAALGGRGFKEALEAHFSGRNVGGADFFGTGSDDPATVLEELGYEDVRVVSCMSQRLTYLSYLFFEVGELFGTAIGHVASDHRLLSSYLTFADEVLLPLVANDARLCEEEGGGSFRFYTARKKGKAEAGDPSRILERLVCPECRGALEADPRRYACPACKMEFPVLAGVPLLMKVYADYRRALSERGGGGLRRLDRRAAWAIRYVRLRDGMRRWGTRVRRAAGRLVPRF